MTRVFTRYSENSASRSLAQKMQRIGTNSRVQSCHIRLQTDFSPARTVLSRCQNHYPMQIPDLFAAVAPVRAQRQKNKCMALV